MTLIAGLQIETDAERKKRASGDGLLARHWENPCLSSVPLPRQHRQPRSMLLRSRPDMILAEGNPAGQNLIVKTEAHCPANSRSPAFSPVVKQIDGDRRLLPSRPSPQLAEWQRRF